MDDNSNLNKYYLEKLKNLIHNDKSSGARENLKKNAKKFIETLQEIEEIKEEGKNISLALEESETDEEYNDLETKLIEMGQDLEVLEDNLFYIIDFEFLKDNLF